MDIKRTLEGALVFLYNRQGFNFSISNYQMHNICFIFLMHGLFEYSAKLVYNKQNGGTPKSTYFISFSLKT
jgi:hypothetical protein